MKLSVASQKFKNPVKGFAALFLPVCFAKVSITFYILQCINTISFVIVYVCLCVFDSIFVVQFSTTLNVVKQSFSVHFFLAPLGLAFEIFHFYVNKPFSVMMFWHSLLPNREIWRRTKCLVTHFLMVVGGAIQEEGGCRKVK